MIRLWNVGKKFKHKVLFENCSFEIHTCGLYGVFGKNGSGKTTLLRLLAGKEKPTAGTVTNDYTTAFVEAKNIVFPNLTVYENLAVFCEEDYRIHTVLKTLGLLALKERRAKLLSMGERVRLGIARAFLLKSEVILLDEPTANLDTENRKILMEMIRKLSENCIIIMSTNSEEDIKYCQHILQISEGRISKEIYEGSSLQHTNKSVYCHARLLKKAVHGFCVLSRLFCYLIAAVGGILIAASLTDKADLLYSGYDYAENTSYMLIPEAYFNDRAEAKAEDTLGLETGGVDIVSSGLFMNYYDTTRQIPATYLENIDLNDTEELLAIPNQIFLHYDSKKYGLSENEIVLTEELYTLFSSTRQLRNNSLWIGDLQLTVSGVEETGDFPQITQKISLRLKETRQFINGCFTDGQYTGEYSLPDFYNLVLQKLYFGCSIEEIRVKDLETAGIYMTRETYKNIIKAAVSESFEIKPVSLMKDYTVSYKGPVEDTSKAMIVSRGFLNAYFKNIPAESILENNGISWEYCLYSGLILDFEITGIAETNEAFISFYGDDGLSKICTDNIGVDVYEVVLPQNALKQTITEVSRQNLLLVDHGFQNILERYQIYNELSSVFPQYILFLIGLLAVILPVVPILSAWRKRKAIQLCGNLNMEGMFYRKQLRLTAFSSVGFAMVSIGLGIGLAYVFLHGIYFIWSFKIIHLSALISYGLIAALWIEVLHIVFLKRCAY